MRFRVLTAAAAAAAIVPVGVRAQAPAELGSEEFGLTAKQLVQNVERVEGLIAKCMRAQGFEYVAVDYMTIRRGMSADKRLPGLGEEEFITTYGFGLSTLYTGDAPQLSDGYSPAREGLGEQNVAIYKNLSPQDQVAYNRALFGDDPTATFAVGLETEDFSRCGGCTREAITEVFDPAQLDASYYNPIDRMINDDPRMKAALRKYGEEMRDAGFAYDHPDEVEADVRERLDAITDGRTVALEELSADRRKALEELQDYERRVATKNMELAEEIFDPIEERIQKEMFSREVK